ncbi:MAG TPA: ROK family protein, partial [Acidimicrobiales bacterium]|nr:ROK family protein [Acidimicrobiales bacterium]
AGTAPKTAASAASAGGSRATGHRAAAGGPAAAAPAARKAPPARKAAAAAPSAAARPAAAVAPARPVTLAIDIGGTGLKASVLDAEGRLLADRVRVATTYPITPEQMVDQLVKLVQPLPAADRVSVGFPGVVRRGHILTAPHFVTKAGPGTKVVKELVVLWTGFDLAEALSMRLGLPVRVANDADLQGWAVISGHGIEMVITLGTGVGTALFADGKLAPHLELAHQPFRKGETYNEQIGEVPLKRIGVPKWRKRVIEAIGNFDRLANYDRLYLGGGNAHHMQGHIDPSVTIVDNVAGIVGGIKLWVHGGH